MDEEIRNCRPQEVAQIHKMGSGRIFGTRMAFTYIDQVHILPLWLFSFFPSHSPKLSPALFIFLHDTPSPPTLFLSHPFFTGCSVASLHLLVLIPEF